MNLLKPGIFTCFLLFAGFAKAQPAANWKSIGPIAFPTNVSGQINGIGRVSQIKFHPSNANKMYAVSASGGLWVSNDQAANWQKTGTDMLPKTTCSAVCIDNTNDSIIYLSTGDANYYNSSFGIWKSIDAGQTWKQSTAGIGNKMAVEILMNPADNRTLIAATNAGIWKTTDAGATWVVKFNSGQFTDMVEKPKSNGRVLYACTMDNFYRSVDYGETWQLITTGLAYPSGFTGGEGLRLAVSNADSNVVYVGMIVNRGTIYRSADGGTSFTIKKNDFNQSIVGYDETSAGQGNYNFDITADPNNANILYLVAHCVWRSTNGGTTWVRYTDWYAGVHTDMHQVVYSPYTSKLFQANDGGVWVATSPPSNWAAKSNGLEATEIYHAATSPTQKGMMSIGSQDNGELYLLGNDWYTNRGGDWSSKVKFDCTPNSSTAYYLQTAKRRDVLIGFEDSLYLPYTGTLDFLEFNKINPELAFTGKSDVYRTTDLSTSPPTWEKIGSFNRTIKAIASSPADANLLYVVTISNKIYRCDNALDAVPVFTEYTFPNSTSPAIKIALSKINPAEIFASAGAKIYKSVDKGITWTNITGSLPNLALTNLICDETSSDGALFAGNATAIYYRNDTTANWSNFSQGLPTIANINDFMVYDDGTNSSVLRVAYYGRGVWETPIPKSIPLAINNIALLPVKMSIVPNPNDGNFEVRLDNIDINKNTVISLFDVTGRIIKQDVITNNTYQFDLKGLVKGFYLVNIKNSNLNITKRVAVQ